MVRSGYMLKDMGTRKAVERALTGATLNKLIFAAFTMAGALFPFVIFRLDLESISLTLAVSLSLLLVFGYIVLYCVQVLPSFVTSGSFAPLTLLPMPRREVSLVAGMTLWRTLDYILFVSLASQVAAVAYFTGSALATVLVIFASVSSSVLAVGLALWLTSVFQNRVEGGGLSGMRAFFRPLYFVLWGLGVMSAVFLFTLVSYVAPPLQAALSAPTSPAGFVLSLLFPFSVGVLSSYLSGATVGAFSLAVASVGMAAGLMFSALASATVIRTISGVVLPSGGARPSLSRADLRFRILSPLSAYILKDIRVSSRNPATGFLFALPLFEIIAVVIPLTAAQVVRMSAVIVGSQVGGGFALFVAFLLVTVEDLGVESRTALPFVESVRTLSKVVVSTATFLPVPVALALVLLVKPTTYAGGALIPVVTGASVLAACVVEVSVLKALGDAGRGTAVRFAAGVGCGEAVLALPAFFYALDYVLSRTHSAALELFLAATAAEVLMAALILRAKARGGRRSANSGAGR